VRRSQINVERAEYQLEQAELDLESNVYQALVDARGALKHMRRPRPLKEPRKWPLITPQRDLE
jgi:hypothetical protein